MISQNILDYGGTDDNATANDAPLSNAITALGAGGTVKFSRTAAGVGQYLFANSSVTPIGTVVLDVDVGVTLVFPDDSILYNQKVRVVRDTKIFCVNLQDTYTFSAHENQDWSAKALYIGPGDLDHSSVASIQANSALLNLAVAWPAGDTFVPASAASATANSVTLQPPFDNMRHVSMLPAVAGDEIAAVFGGIVNQNQLLHAMIRTTNGYYGLDCGTLANAMPSLFVKLIGQTAIYNAVSVPALPSHASYAGINSVWSIRINTPTNFSVMWNSSEIVTLETSGQIYQAGFGTIVTYSGAAAVTTTGWTRATNKFFGGRQALSLYLGGDSKTCPKYGTLADSIREALEGTGGLRVQIANNGVAGDASAQCLAKLQAVGLGNASRAHFDIGTNDVQGPVAIATYLSNVQQIIQYCQTRGVIPTFSIFSMWYTQGQVGPGIGQLSSHYDQGANYRMSLQRLCADMGVDTLDLNQELGAQLSFYRNGYAGTDWSNLGFDTGNFDNIHDTPYFARLKGYAIAKFLAGRLIKTPSRVLGNTGFATSYALNSWAFGYTSPTYTMDAQGNTTLWGQLRPLAGASRANATQILLLPENIPIAAGTDPRQVWADGAHADVLIDKATRTLQIYNMGSGSYISLDGLTIRGC